MNYEMVPNVFATGLFLVLYWLHRSSRMQEGHGGNVNRPIRVHTSRLASPTGNR